ncbi:MAG: hypothetical protein KGM17_06990 [Sphingomonadales bacterium]|nr:hypothetical protein [Sphingomonadales bacterium]
MDARPSRILYSLLASAGMITCTPLPAAAPIDPASVPMPELTFAPTAASEAEFDQYFYFYRPETTFAEAMTDIVECDELSRDLQFHPSVAVPGEYQYSMASVLAMPLAGELVRLFSEPGEKRKLRRFNLRHCMAFKGYGRYGLTRMLWQRFNFEYDAPIDEAKRLALLAVQARAASGPVPTTPELAP